MKQQVFHPSWILRVTMFLFGLFLLGFLIGEGFSQEETFLFKLFASLTILLFALASILVSICFFPFVTITSQYIKIGLRSPMEWSRIKEIKKQGLDKIEALFISYLHEDLASETLIKKTYVFNTYVYAQSQKVVTSY